VDVVTLLSRPVAGREKDREFVNGALLEHRLRFVLFAPSVSAPGAIHALTSERVQRCAALRARTILRLGLHSPCEMLGNSTSPNSPFRPPLHSEAFTTIL